MFRIYGNCRVTNLKKVSDKMTVGDVYSSRNVMGKDGKPSEEWETTFIKAKFVGESLKQMKKMKIKNKDQFVIEESVFQTEKSGQYENQVVTIFKVSEFIPKDDITPVDGGDQPF